MTPWSWWAGELDADNTYDLAAEEKTREAALQVASRQLKRGERFQIIEARSSTDAKYEGADFVPFLRTRNHEIITVGPVVANEPLGVMPSQPAQQNSGGEDEQSKTCDAHDLDPRRMKTSAYCRHGFEESRGQPRATNNPKVQSS